MFQKHLHYSFELEAAVLGICMLEKTAFGRTHGIIDREVLYFEGNKIVHDAISEMYGTGLPVDLFTTCDALYQKGVNNISGQNTDYYVSRLTNNVVSSAHLEYHCYILKRMWMEREVILITRGGIPLDGTINNKLIQLQTAIARIKSGDYQKDWYDMSELMIGLYKHQESIAKGDQVYVKTGIAKLDEINGGFYGGQSIIVGARPGAGKSAFMGQLALNIAQSGKTVGIISLEMSNNEIAGRLAAIDSDIDFGNIYRNLFSDQNQRERFHQRIGSRTSGLPIFVSDATKLSPIDIRAKADKLKKMKGLDCLFIDYLQLISSDQPANKNRENIVSEISRANKIMAKELNIPVIALCQLNRTSTQRHGEQRYPQLSDLRESGSLEQDADIVMFIHRDWAVGMAVDENGDSTEGKADIIVRKWRNGEANLHIPVGFDGPKMAFRFNQRSQWKQIKPEVDYQGDNPF